MKTTATVIAILVSLFVLGCQPPDGNTVDTGRPDYATIDGIWRVNVDEIFDNCSDAENLCAEGDGDECISSNEWFWVTVQDYTNGIYTTDFAMSDLYWEDVVVEDGVFENTLDLSAYGWLYNISGTVVPSNGDELGEMTATIELGALDLENPDAKFYCRIVYELWGYPLYDANAG